MSEKPIKIRRKNKYNLLKEAKKLESFDEFPMLRPDVDPQFHASRNSIDQPFFVRGEKDMVLVQYSGASRLAFTSGPVRYFDLGLADFVYVPAGIGHRLLTREEGIVGRFKAIEPGKETIFWVCDRCDEEVFAYSFDATQQLAQIGYQAGCEAFNASDLVCKLCGTEHAPVDLSAFRWARVAECILTQVDEDKPDEEPVH